MRKSEDLEQDLSRRGPEDVYALCGPAEYLMERFAERVASEAQAPLVRVDAAEVAPEALAVEHLVPDLFGTPKVVLVTGAQAWKPKARTRLLEEVAAAGVPAGKRLLVTWTATRPPRGGIPKEGVQAAFFWKPFPSVLPRMVEGWIREKGGKPGRGVGDRLVEAYGDDLRRMDQEAFKLAVSTKGSISPRDVDRLCMKPLESKAFRIAEAITAGERALALRGLAEVLATEGPHGLVAMLANRFRRMLALKRVAEAAPGPARRAFRAAEELGSPRGRRLPRAKKQVLEGEIQELLDAVPPGTPDLGGLKVWQATGLLRHAERFSGAALEDGLVACARVDRQLKGEGGVEAWALERLILELRTA